jgi:NAD(P)-dependent dehydrogenase (short-subunit alcohol dehydrogenase family)
VDIAKNKIVVVGGTSGIGRAVAELAHEEGARVIIVGRDPVTATSVAHQIGRGVVGLGFDVTDANAVAKLATEVEDFDHLVLSSAALTYGPFLKMSLEEARQVMESKFWGYYQTVRELVPRMSEQGSITLLSGVAAVRPSPGAVMVTAVDAAIEGLTRALAVELAPRRVNAVSPGVVETPGWGHLSDEERVQMFQQVARSLPVGRIGQPADVARAVLELAANGYSTGDIRHVDGGARLA